MPIYEYGEMWDIYPESDLFLITANSTVTKDGRLVMGAGIAREARDRFPGLDRALGSTVGYNQHYGVLWSPKWPEKKLGVFQVKYHWREKASLKLIKLSTTKLKNFAQWHPECRIDLNFPGIGNGRLDYDEVKPIINELPNNVHIWQKSKFRWASDE